MIKQDIIHSYGKSFPFSHNKYGPLYGTFREVHTHVKRGRTPFVVMNNFIIRNYT